MWSLARDKTINYRECLQELPIYNYSDFTRNNLELEKWSLTGGGPLQEVVAQGGSTVSKLGYQL